MTESVDAGWRVVFGPASVRIHGDTSRKIAVRSIEAAVLPDLRVCIRLNTIRGERLEVVASGHLRRDGHPFTLFFDEPEQGRLDASTLNESDFAWFTDFKVPGLTGEQLETIVFAYAQAEAVAVTARPARGSDQKVERLDLVLSSRGTRVLGLRYVVESPQAPEGERLVRLEVWRVHRGWTVSKPSGRLDESRPVLPEMVSTVLAAIDSNLVITRAAAILSANPPQSTIIGEDPSTGIVRRHMDPVFEDEIQNLLKQAHRFPADNEDIAFLRAITAGTELSETKRVFEAFTRLATVIFVDQPDVESVESEWVLGGAVEWRWPEWWVSQGLLTPSIPRQARGNLLRSRDFTVWSTADFLPGFTVYGHHHIVPEFMTALESNAIAPFFMAGLAGHGFNSYGVGIVARFDEFIVALQTAYGGAFMREGAADRVCAMVDLWNEFVKDVEALLDPRRVVQSQGARWLITFSNYRGYAAVHERDEGFCSDSGFPGGQAPTGWRPLLELDREGVDPSGSIQPDADESERLVLARSLVNELVRAHPVVREERRDQTEQESPQP